MQRAALLQALGEISAAQAGYFSTTQAQKVGASPKQLIRLVDAGLLERDDRGIYRFASYPLLEKSELWRAVLWPDVDRSKTGERGSNNSDAPNLAVLSHGTALELWNVSTINPNRIDITLPKKARVRRKIPALYNVHRADLAAKDITYIDGLPVTTLYRTLLDLIVDGQHHQFVDEALDNAVALPQNYRAELQALRAVGSAMLHEVHTILANRA